MRVDGVWAQIDVLSPPAAVDGYGAPTGSWTTAYSGLWALCEPLLGQQYLAAQAVQTRVSVKFRLRWLDGITSRMRVSCEGRTYEVIDAMDVGNRHRELVLYCRRIGA